jgi:hypothetical protein
MADIIYHAAQIAGFITCASLLGWVWIQNNKAQESN